MFELKLRKYQGNMYVADNKGNIICKRLRADQILDINRYKEKRIKRLSNSASAKTNSD